jgi:peptide-methionine (R)-S-oxide reductase
MTESTTVSNPKIEKSDEEWRQELTAEEYAVTRQAGTERAFSGEYCNTKTPGSYLCRCCGAELFSSETKYDSGSGWPSFWEAAAEGAVSTHTDTTHGMVRTEARCSRCDAHLGHIFPDGPQPTGDRYCMNSVSLKLEPK